LFCCFADDLSLAGSLPGLCRIAAFWDTNGVLPMLPGDISNVCEDSQNMYTIARHGTLKAFLRLYYQNPISGIKEG